MIGVGYKCSGISSLRSHGIDFAHLEVYSSSHTLARLDAREGFRLTDGDSPVSVDIPVNVFYRANGSKVRIPFELQPGEIIFAESPVKTVLNDGEYLSLETKSNVARTGLSVLGFCKDGKYATTLGFEDRAMMVYMKNDASVPYVIDDVPYPFQVVTSVPRSDPERAEAGSIKIYNPEREDITEKAERKMGGMNGYVFTLSPEMWGMESMPGKKIRWSERKYDVKHLFREGLIGDMDLARFPFILTLSNETIEAGCPAYVFPFRTGSVPMDYFSGGHAREKEIRQYILSPAVYRKITGNAGLIQKGSRNKTVFEISAGKRCERDIAEKLKEFLKVDAEFGFMIPLVMKPHNSTENHYNGKSIGQEKICVL
ncbi:MAG: hypothetical protein V1648_03725 [Candidatus Aenigmatarchaeota archaeon]